jgi:hypothetical protein
LKLDSGLITASSIPNCAATNSLTFSNIMLNLLNSYYFYYFNWCLWQTLLP